MLLPDLLARCPSAAITFTQATYVKLAASVGVYRIDFIAKAEFQLRKGTEGPLAHFPAHPLLQDHNEPKLTLHLGSKPIDSDAFIQAIAECITQMTHGWRTWRSYTFQQREVPRSSINKGRGTLLQSAPLSLALEVLTICHQHGVVTYYFEPEKDLPPAERPYSVLFIGNNFVVARDFRVQSL